ncbi:MAG: DUF2723 domain-containing protein [Bacteroidaceae bacterium]|nr:DUF2723 domain-containing protein [Bacteroidaceae bacterium]
MKTYKLVNNVVGWIVFAVAALTYCSTIEPTASFWDCPEFITTASKMEIGHPPGAPFFMLLGNLFSQFASDSTQIAKMINTMSALLSAGCILFLFWTITYFAKALIVQPTTSRPSITSFGSLTPDSVKEVEPSLAQTIAIMASGICGALIYTWSDTFWFSAVEGEVYAFSSFLTALVFWLILKWEQHSEEPGSDRWLILIFYLMGLSIGVHLLNLLCIPAIVLVFYYKKSKNPTAKGSLIALGISALIIVAVLYGIVPGIGKVAGWFELLFVNNFGLPYNSGLYVYLVILVSSLAWAIIETIKGQNRTRINVLLLVCVALLGIPFYGHGVSSVVIGIVILAILAYCVFQFKGITIRGINTSLLCMALIVVGYSSYAVIVIRSTANPMMDQNSPEDVFTLGEYLGREQYGERPLFYGQTYASRREIIEEDGEYRYNTTSGAPVYQRKNKTNPNDKDEYVVVREKFDYVYPSDQCMLFPRIYDTENNHPQMYQQWLGDVETKEVQYSTPEGSIPVRIPTQAANIRYFFSYQMNFMYWRYFMWNFAGRQNDIQGLGDTEHGNWITGFDFLDNLRLGNQSLLPTILKENKGHNVFYCLPLILGLIGFFWQAFRGKKGIQQFWVVFFLFFMTGIAIVLYLNQTPVQPRERDYAYAGSFYAFAIWCGLGITAIYSWLEKLMNKSNKRVTALLASCISIVPALAVPLQMISQTWDDHDRSGRYMCRDFGLNYLQTIPHDGVIFTNGDNDTFPLWYNEDTEGNRTDVRVCNLSYLQTDWYIDQMKRPAFEGEGQSSPLPITWTREQYTTGQNEIIYIDPVIDMGETKMKISQLVQIMYEENRETAEKIWGKEPFELKNAIKKFILKEGIPEEYKEMVKSLPSCLPSDSLLYVNVDKKAVKRSGMKIINDSIPDKMYIDLKDRDHIYKSFVMMLEMIANSNFSRPLYMSTTVGPSNYGGLIRNFVQEGLAWRITPYTIAGSDHFQTVCDTEKMYDNMMNKYRYGNLKQKGLYLDETITRMCQTHRNWFARLITSLIMEGKMDMAKKALQKCETEIPEYNVPYDANFGALDIANAYLILGQKDKGMHVLSVIEKNANEYIRWYMSLNDVRFANSWRDLNTQFMFLANVQNLYNAEGKGTGANAELCKKKAAALKNSLDALYNSAATRAVSIGIKLN